MKDPKFENQAATEKVSPSASDSVSFVKIEVPENQVMINSQSLNEFLSYNALNMQKSQINESLSQLSSELIVRTNRKIIKTDSATIIR